MAANGELEKMLILAFQTPEEAETGGTKEAQASIDVLINPESYTIDYKVKTEDAQAPGTSATELKFLYLIPEELSFEFLFDNTGIIDNKPKPEGIFPEVDALRKMLVEFQPGTHKPFHLKLVWGNLIFKGVAVELSITHKLFNSDGQPIRSVAKAKFKGSIEEKMRARKEDRSSADLTHQRKMKAGETLPLLCHQIYGDSRHYLSVARANNLGNFRDVTPGTNLVFPPIAKTGNDT